MSTRRRAGLWIVFGVATASIVVLNDIGRLLADIETHGRQAYGPKAFTGFRLRFWDTTDLANAITLWRENQTAFDVHPLLSWHLQVDAWLFTPAYCLLIGLLIYGTSAENVDWPGWPQSQCS